jgi:biopolymer transport protein ExbD
MGKVRPKKSAPHTDMTAMTDVAFLLLTFFIMTATFKNNEAAEITTPSSISQIKVPDDDIMIISIDPTGKVFFGVDAMPTRVAMLENIASVKGLSFTDEEKYKFSIQPSFGFPVAQLKGWLSMPPDQMVSASWRIGCLRPVRRIRSFVLRSRATMQLSFRCLRTFWQTFSPRISTALT